MTPAKQAEVTRKARQDAAAMNAGWPTKGNPYQDRAEADLWQEIFELALKEGK